jgi:N-acetylglucosamine-6-sulfatase
MQLQSAGYDTAYFGKWHMGENNDAPRPGFDHWMSHKGQGRYFDNEFNINGSRSTVRGYYTKVVTDAACEWIGAQGERPFCLILGHKAPHSPNQPEPRYAHVFDEQKIEYPPTVQPPPDKPLWIPARLTTWHGVFGPLWGRREKTVDVSPEGVREFAAFVRDYYATILSVDDSVGRVYEQLAKTGKLDNTLLVFIGDNGFFLGEHGMMDKRAMHEPSIRIPLLVRYPKIGAAGRVSRELVLNVDLAPSVLDICGVAHKAKMHGASWKQLLEDRPGGWRASFLYEYNYEKQFPYTPNVRGIRTEDWKFIRYPHGDGKPDRHKVELYDLKADPGETRNLAGLPEHRARRKELEAELGRLGAALGPETTPLDEGIKTGLPDIIIR